ncbi:MAG: CIA30 family protein [Geminicoccaceae bacterium]|nr:CIA30 family protein [Geminicoccaceae bacterium]
MLVDDARGPLSRLGTPWRCTTDRVMGGVSEASLSGVEAEGRPWRRLRGGVRLDNDGGFVQMGLDLAPDGGTLDLSAFEGLRLLVVGNGETYGLHLRTRDCRHPWESYRAAFAAGPVPAEVDFPFKDFIPHRLDAPFDPARLRRLALIAIGREFQADLWLGRIEAVPR